MVTAQDVLEYISQAGPVLPKHVAEAFGISTLFASAFLSELSSKQSIRTSHLKIGGSPLYYTIEHRDRLVDYRANLHEKEQKTFELLRSERVLDDTSLELLDRVALRKMQDFAVPLAVDVGGVRRIFWKYYLATDDEATAIIAEILSSVRETPPTPEEPTEEDLREERDVPVERITEPQLSQQPQTTTVPEPVPQPANEEPESGSKSEPARSETEAKPKEEQARINIERVTHAPDASEALTTDPLGKQLLVYFEEKAIRIIEAEVARKNTCLGICSVPSPVGDLDYYFYAKDKKSITDKDVKEAFAEAAILGYPLLFIAKGDVKKSAIELVSSKIKGSIIIEL
jgi:hypothetical protein